MRTTNTSRKRQRRGRKRRKERSTNKMKLRKENTIQEAVRALLPGAALPSPMTSVTVAARRALVALVADVGSEVAWVADTTTMDTTTVCLHRQSDHILHGFNPSRPFNHNPATARSFLLLRAVWSTSRHPGGTPGFSSISKGCNRLTSRRG